ncbi:fluconazole resistance protein 1 [Colletotrichum tofieldiae]|nr:fluconazole resistance protein 1 [Colletotrichum tofieldiae]
MVGACLLPIGLFWFAWTNGPEIHWIVSIIASGFFAAGLVLVFLSLLNYLIDSYVIFAASVLAANSVMRSLFGAAFPLFTTQMYENLGIHWASSIPAFLALACLPFPFLFYKYGHVIRRKCAFAAEAAAVLERMRKTNEEVNEDEAMAEEEKNEHERVKSASASDGGVLSDDERTVQGELRDDEAARKVQA